MAAKKLTVVISQHQGKHPVKRQLEEELAAALIVSPDVDVSIVPHVYDMSADHTGMLFLRSIGGPLVVLSWLYPRAVRWTLDRQGVRGREGMTLLKAEGEDEDDFDEASESEDEPKGIGSLDVPNRRIWCLDLRAYDDPQVYLDEIRRIAADCTVQTVDLLGWINGSPKPDQLQRYLNPLPIAASPPAVSHSESHSEPEPTKRRWYPVIDYSKCTNCMECIDFCLFGVYGVDKLDRILVEEQDNCKKGCPACSRVCPENAIIFPQHKTPAIAGAAGEVAGLKIDLSRLFGGDDGGRSPLELAVMERDTELVADGREAVGMAVGIPKRQSGAGTKQRDDLDDLMDGLDGLDL
jgi:Pyruvate/2-oxoacid:ferredoxin oxidoreductase delta subunit